MQSALTERERQVAEALSEGLSWHGVAERLQISPSTVRAHVDRIFQKIGGHGRKTVCIVRYYTATHLSQ